MASVGKNVLRLSTGSGNFLNQDLAFEGISIRQYGASGIGTISRRGADPSQLQVLWNGIVLNNPMLGMVDLGLLQNDAHCQITLTEGSSGSFYGSGSVGGTLSLQHAQPQSYGKTIAASILAGSFGRWQGNGGFQIRKKNSYLIWDQHWSQISNHFSYKVENSSAGRMQFANRNQWRSHLSAGFHYKKWEAGMHAEWQQGQRGLGTSAGGTYSLGEQFDENKRLVLHAAYQTKKIKWVQRLGLVQDKIIFQMPGNTPPDSSRSQSIQYQQEWHFHLKKWNAVTGLDAWYLSGQTRHYDRTVKNIFPAQFLTFFRQSRRYRLAAGTRWEWHERIAVNSLSAEYATGTVVNVKASVSNSFRRPTINDLYWSSGGNLNLKPEEGGNAEAGLSARWDKRQVKIDLSATLWARYLNNPIVWLPENNVWSASNMQRGDYHGAQFSALLSHSKGKTPWQWQAGAEWCNARMRKENHSFSALFVPRFSGATSLKVKIRNWNMRYACQWQSSRFTSTDNQSSLPGYALFSVDAGREVSLKKYRMHVMAGSDNLLNHSYQVMPGRPMPMRSFWLKATFNLTKSNHL